MPKDILLYDNINAYSATDIINAMNAWTEKKLILRVNTNGGDPAYMWGIIAKFIEFVGDKLVKVDMKAYSGGLYLLCYCDDSEALDVSQGVLHRAAYAEWIENDPTIFTENLQNMLADINKNLEAAFRAKVNIEVFENLKQMKDKGLTTKDVFSMDSRIDVFLTAKDMKKIGLVNRIIPITPVIKSEIQSYAAAAKYTEKEDENTEPIVKPVTKNKVMTLQELKDQHPSVYAQAVAEGVIQGIEKEKDRVEGIMVFNHIAPEICKAAIDSGKNLTEKQRNEIILKQVSANALATLENENAEDVKTAEVKVKVPEKVDAKAKAAAEVEAEVMAELKDLVIK